MINLVQNKEQIMADITARDLANMLGISTAAVSMALNGKPGVSSETRTKVLAAATKLGYVTPKSRQSERQAKNILENIIYPIRRYCADEWEYSNNKNECNGEICDYTGHALHKQLYSRYCARRLFYNGQFRLRVG